MRVKFKRTDSGRYDVEIERVGPGRPERKLRARDMLVPRESEHDEHWHPMGTDADAPKV